MLEIKTIVHKITDPEKFDKMVNDALAEGWELVRRDVLPAEQGLTTEYYRCLYAELERLVDEPDEEVEDQYNDARWELTRNPRIPFRCSSCGYTSGEQWPECPECGRTMRSVEV